MTYRDDPRWQEAHEALLSEGHASPTEGLLARVQAALDLGRIEHEHEERAA